MNRQKLDLFRVFILGYLLLWGICAGTFLLLRALDSGEPPPLLLLWTIGIPSTTLGALFATLNYVRKTAFRKSDPYRYSPWCRREFDLSDDRIKFDRSRLEASGYSIEEAEISETHMALKLKTEVPGVADVGRMSISQPRWLIVHGERKDNRWIVRIDCRPKWYVIADVSSLSYLGIENFTKMMGWDVPKKLP